MWNFITIILREAEAAQKLPDHVLLLVGALDFCLHFLFILWHRKGILKQSTIYFEKEESFISFFVSSGFQDQKMTREKSPKSIRHERMHRPLCKFEIQYTNRVGRGPTFWFLEIILAHFLFCFSSTCSFIHHGWLAIFLPSLNCSSCAYRLLGIPALSFFFSMDFTDCTAQKSIYLQYGFFKNGRVLSEQSHAKIRLPWFENSSAILAGRKNRTVRSWRIPSMIDRQTDIETRFIIEWLSYRKGIVLVDTRHVQILGENWI